MKIIRGATPTLRFGSLINATTGARLTTSAAARVCIDGTWGNAAGTLAVEETDQYKYTPHASETVGSELVVAIDHASAVDPIVERFQITNVVEVQHTGDDTDSGALLAAALTAYGDQPGYHIQVGPGRFEILSSNFALAATLEGAGKFATLIEFAGTTGDIAIRPASGSVVKSLTLRENVDGFLYGALGSDPAFERAVLDDVYLHSANLEPLELSTTNACHLIVRNCDVYCVSEWAATVGGATHLVEVYKLRVIIPGNNSPTDYKLFAAKDGAKIYAFDCCCVGGEEAMAGQVVRVTDDSQIVLVNGQFFAGEFHVEDAPGLLYMIGCEFDRSAAKFTGETARIVDIHSPLKPTVPGRTANVAATGEVSVPAAEHGRIWFVAASGGNNANSGSLSSPLATFGEADSRANPGDTIFLLPGTHTGGVTVSTPSLTIEGAGDTSILQRTSDGACLTVLENTTLRRIKVVATSTSQGLAVSAASGTNNVHVTTCTLQGTSDAIFLQSANGLRIVDSVLLATFDAANIAGSRGIIENCLLSTDGSFSTSQAARAIVATGNSSLLIRNCRLIATRDTNTAQRTIALELGDSGVVQNSRGNVTLENCDLLATSSHASASGLTAAIGQNALRARAVMIGGFIRTSKAGSGAEYAIDASTTDSDVRLYGVSADRTKFNGVANIYDDATIGKAVYSKLPSKSHLAGTNNSDGDVQMDEATGNFPGSVNAVASDVPLNEALIRAELATELSRIDEAVSSRSPASDTTQLILTLGTPQVTIAADIGSRAQQATLNAVVEQLDNVDTVTSNMDGRVQDLMGSGFDENLHSLTATGGKLDAIPAAVAANATIAGMASTVAANLDAKVSEVEGGGGGGFPARPVSQIAVPFSRTFVLKNTDDGWRGELPLVASLGDTGKLWALDWRNDLPTNGRVADILAVDVLSGPTGGITLGNDLEDTNDYGVDRSQAKFRLHFVTAGRYTLGVTVEYDPADGGGEGYGEVELIVRPT